MTTKRVFILICAIIASVHSFPTFEKNPEEAGYFQGDIRFPEGLDPRSRSGIIGETYRWPGGVIPIQIDTEFSQAELAVVNSGLQDITSKTCIRFVTRTTEQHWVFIDRGLANSGCSSYVGKINRGAQPVNLQPSIGGSGHCITKGIVAHEMIHAIGFYHEHSRTDRDDYVTINWSNIQNGYAYAFDKYLPSQVSDQGVSYDYGSVMHYGAYGFAVNPSVPTIIVPPGVVIGQRNGLSEKDAQKIRNMYRC